MEGVALPASRVNGGHESRLLSGAAARAALFWLLCLAGPAAAADLVVDGQTVVLDGTHSFANVRVVNGGVLTHSAATTGAEFGLTLTVSGTLTVDASSRIDASGRGYLPGRTLGNSTQQAAAGRAGGSHGGLGFAAEWTTNDVYDDHRDPNRPGSGAGPEAVGGAGGGVLRISASQVVLDGAIRADGGDGGGAYPSGGGGGAGGSVRLDAGTLAGSGVISANGGKGNIHCYYGCRGGGGGGGGRVAIYGNDAGFDPAKITALGGENGTNDYGPGATGTVYRKRTGSPGELRVAGSVSEPGAWTPLGLPGQDQAEFENVLVSGPGVVAAPVHDLPIVADNLTLSGGALLTHPTSTRTEVFALRLTVRDALSVDADSAIDVSGRGHRVGRGPGNRWIGAAGNLGGGSYGGLGGNTSNFTYGDPLNPEECGAGGGLGRTGGGHGGGLVRIHAGRAAIDGAVRANGADGWNGEEVQPGGSGGGILLDVGTLSGSGTISANGGRNGIVCYYGCRTGGSGGGGRVAIYARESDTFDRQRVVANGGNGEEPGRPGSVEFPAASTFVWSLPTGTVLQGTERLAWGGLGTDPEATTVEVVAAGTDVRTLAAGQKGVGNFAWDTATVPDGRYELRAIFRDAQLRTLGVARRQVLVANSAQRHRGRIAANVTWPAGAVHVVARPLSVEKGATLTIEPGAVVKFAPRSGIAVEDGAAVVAAGNAEAPIVLTSLRDDDASGDTNGDGGATTPHPGDWDGFLLSGTGRTDFNGYVSVRFASLSHGGRLAASQTWSPDFVHEIISDVVIPDDVTLTVEPGTLVKMGRLLGFGIQPRGRLDAVGTPGEPVVLTSTRDAQGWYDVDMSAAPPAPEAGDWRWVDVGWGKATFEHARIRYGGGTSSGAWDQTGVIRTGNGSVLRVANSVVQDAYFDGILAWGGETTVENVVLTGIDRAVCAHPGGTVHVRNCTLDDNRIGLLVHGGTMDVANTVVSNSIESGVQYDFGTLGSLRYSNVWSAVAASQNYRNTPSRTGTDGNISADPRYRDRERDNFQPDYGSPLIDAADGTLAPATDLAGAPRWDDPRSANSGVAGPGGVFADVGAYEFGSAAPSDVDLVVTEVLGPGVAEVGGVVSLRWTVTNAGTGTAVGPWRDAIYLVTTVGEETLETLVAEVEVSGDAPLQAGETRNFEAEVLVPGALLAEQRWRVVTNRRGDVYEGANAENNGREAETPVSVGMAILLPGEPVEGALRSGASQAWFAFRRSAGHQYVLDVEAAEEGPRLEMFVKSDRVPTREEYDYRSDPAEHAAHRLVVPGGNDGYYYVLLVAPGSPDAGSFTLTLLEDTALAVAAVVPSSGGTADPVTFEVRGGNFGGGTRAFLVAGAVEREADEVFVESSSVLFATFDTPSLPPGAYDLVLRGERVEIGDDGTVTERDVEASLDAGVRLVSGSPGALEVRMTAKDVQRAGRPLDVWITYANRGGGDLVAPVLLIEAASSALRIENDDTVFDDTAQFVALSPSGPADRLRPGQAETVRVTVTPHPSLSSLTITASEAVAGAGGPDIDAAADAAGVPLDTEWGRQTAEGMKALLGTTWGAYLDALGELSYEYSFAPPVNSVGPLLRYGAALSAPEEGEPGALPAPGAVGGGASLLCDPPPVPPDHPRFDAWPTGPEYAEDPARLMLYKGYLRPIYQGTKNIGRYKYASIHLEHFLDNTGTPVTYPEGHEFSKEVARDPGLRRFVAGNGGEFGVALKRLVQSLGEPMACGERKRVSQKITVRNTTPGLGISWQNENAQQGIGGVDTAIMDVSIALSRDRDRVTATGSVKVHLRDFYHWAGHSAYHDANYSPPWNWWATYLEYYCEAKGFTIDMDLGTFPVEAWANVSVKEDSGAGGKPCKQAVQPPRPPAGPASASTSVRLVGSYDPNEKIASGTGRRGYLGDAEFVAYTIRFENKSSASAPAQEVVITDSLDPALDWATLELVAVGFNDRVVEIPRGRQSYAGLVAVGSDPNPVRIGVDLDVESGLLTLRLRSEDPVTGELPEDPMAGFLPPNDAEHRGEGFLSFTVKPRPGLADGAQIRNGARIFFDLNEPIDTNEVISTIGEPPPPCTGDCDESGEVGADELVAAVNIALGIVGAVECPAADASAEGRVTIEELVDAVARALAGCPGAARTIR